MQPRTISKTKRKKVSESGFKTKFITNFHVLMCVQVD